MNRRLLLILILALASRLLLMAQSPFELDSVLLMRGVEAFDPTAMRPHPPGYAGLVFLAKGLPLAPDTALRTLSALAVLPLLWGTWTLSEDTGSDPLLATLLVACNPVAWMLGLTANAYALPAAAALWFGIAALRLRQGADWRMAGWTGLLWGCATALRPSLSLFLLPLLIWASRRQLGWALLGAIPPVGVLLGLSALGSGGLLPYLEATWAQFAFIQQSHPPNWRLHQLHHLVVYAAQICGGGLLLLPWLKRPKQAGGFALWVLPALGFFALIHLAKAGYLLALLPPVAVVLAGAQAPKALKWAAPVLSAACFLLARPIDVELDPSPKAAFSDKQWSQRVHGELSFWGSASLERVRQQERSNRAYVTLLQPLVIPGRTVLVGGDRWEPTLASELLSGVEVVNGQTALSAPPSGLRVLYLSWQGAPGFSEVTGPQGHGVWLRDLDAAQQELGEEPPSTAGN